MPRQMVGRVFRRYAVAWLYLAGFCLVDVSYQLLPAHDRAALVHWASTSVHNLEHHPVGCLVVSAFVPSGFEPRGPSSSRWSSSALTLCSATGARS